MTDRWDIEVKRQYYDPRAAENIRDLCAECFSDPWSLDNISEALKAEQNVFFTAGEGRDGFAAASVAADQADILDVAVAPSLRRRGLARAMLSALLCELRTRGVSEVFLEVREHNLAAIALYTSLGFSPCGIRKNYYSSPRENALVYVLDMEVPE